MRITTRGLVLGRETFKFCVWLLDFKTIDIFKNKVLNSCWDVWVWRTEEKSRLETKPRPFQKRLTTLMMKMQIFTTMIILGNTYWWLQFARHWVKHFTGTISLNIQQAQGDKLLAPSCSWGNIDRKRLSKLPKWMIHLKPDFVSELLSGMEVYTVDRYWDTW